MIEYDWSKVLWRISKDCFILSKEIIKSIHPKSSRLGNELPLCSNWLSGSNLNHCKNHPDNFRRNIIYF